MSNKNKETLQNIYENMGTFLKEFEEPEKKKEEQKMTKEEVEQIVTEAVKKVLQEKETQEQKQEQKQDPREELVHKLLEYKKFKEVTEDFKKREQKAALVCYKEADKAIQELKQSNTEDSLLCGITLEHLYQAFTEVMKRREIKIDKVRSSFKSVERDLYTFSVKHRFSETFF